MNIRRWTLTASPIATYDPDGDRFSRRLADAANRQPDYFFTRAGARRSARHYERFFPLRLEAVRRESAS